MAKSKKKPTRKKYCTNAHANSEAKRLQAAKFANAQTATRPDAKAEHRAE